MSKKLICVILVASLTLSACGFGYKNKNISITSKDNESSLDFKAHYPEDKTAIIQRYIESSFKEDRIFKSITDSKKVKIRLENGSQFYLNYEPGFIAINFDRESNSIIAYQQMKRMISGFANALKN